MCGLLVWLCPPDNASRATFSNALALQRHRGPDDMRTEFDEKCWLGHNRLSILDLSSAAQQPMTSEDGRYRLVYNGEVYNYVELRQELQGQGYKFRSSGDTEVVLAAFAEWGESAFSKFNGMWSLAIWDRKDRRLTVCRDRYGIKPLYAARYGAGWLFASEIKPLLRLRQGPRRLSRDAFDAFFSEGITDAITQTWFDGIERVMPATIWVMDADGDRAVSTWYDLPDQRDLSYDRAVEEFEHVLQDSVRIALRSDVPLGVCLSSGTDSSIIAAIASSEQQVDSFTVRHDRPDSDEFLQVEQFARGRAICPHGIWPDWTMLAGDLSKLVWHLEEPAKAPGVYSQWLVMRKAREHVRVLLDGQGGDEILGGYSSQRASFLWGLACNLNFAAMSREAGAAGGWRSIARLLTSDLRTRMMKPVYAPFWATVEALRDGPNIWPKPVRRSIRARLSASPSPAWSLSRRLQADVYRDSLPSLLRYEDKVSMAFSLESRVPLLDHRLVDLSFRLQETDLIREGLTKYPLRQALEGVGAADTARRRTKLGFPTPLNVYLRGLVPQIQDWFADGFLVGEGLVDREGLAASLEALLADPHHRTVWHLLQAEWWGRTFIYGDGSSPVTLPERAAA